MKLKIAGSILPLLLASSVAASAEWYIISEDDLVESIEGRVESNGYSLLIGCHDFGDALSYYTPAQASEADVEQLKTRNTRLSFNIDGEELVFDVEPNGGGGTLKFSNFEDIDEYSPELVKSLIAAARTLEVTVLLMNPAERAWRQEFSVRGSTKVLRDVSSACGW